MKLLIEKFGFDTTARPPIYCSQSLLKTDDGLEHYIDGTLRAQVPTTSAVDYLDSPNVSQFLTESEMQAVRGEFTDF
jgi:hypothetical protein